MHSLRSTRTMISGLLIALLSTVSLSATTATTAAFGNEVDDARREVQRVGDEVAAVRRQYDVLANQVGTTQADLDQRQGQIVDLTIELNRRQDILDQRSAEFEGRIRQAYKDGPESTVGVFLASDSLGEFWAANRYLASRLARDRELIQEMGAEQENLAYLTQRLDVDREAVKTQLDQLADLLDQTQELLASSEAALAASQADLQLKEEMRKAMELLNRGSPAGRRPISARHKRATEDQTEVMKRYPFGPVSGIPDGLLPTGETVEGIASWYGPGFNGLPTASGAIYDENLFTCASKELPLGTMLVVTYNGRSVLLLVNDRGPFIKGRVLDLSRAAKDAIGMGGLGYVTAQVVEPA